MTRSTKDSEATLAGRLALREVRAALALSLALLAIVVAAVLIADRDVVAALGGVALAVGVGIGVLVLRRTGRIVSVRSDALAQERAGREQLDRTLAATRQLFEIDSPLELRRQICEIGREVFECSAVSLWEVEPNEIVLLERIPLVHPYIGNERRPIANLPGLREALDGVRPLFVEDLKTTATGVTQATAEVVGTGSLLNVPIAFGGVARLDLVLTWDEVLPGVSETEHLAAQRFADQAGLALEQARFRAAQAEIASLNRTLQRMVQTVPLFHAGGTVDEVGAAICTESLEIFEADGAALWVDTGEEIELVHREPAAAVFAARQRIALAEHPTFGEDLEAGHPRFIADVEHTDPVLWERFARFSRSRSQLRLPLASGGHARALIVLSWADPVPPPSAELSVLASRFADQAGVALAEAARREAQREAAELHERFERSLLPSISLAAADASSATFYRPGDERLSLGGDFYDCLELPDGRIAMLIGDVAGHGAAAAALGAGLRTSWRALVLGGWNLEDKPGGLQAVCVRERHDPHLFVTALMANVSADRSVLRFVSAGHPAPIVVGRPALGDVVNGPPLGVVGDASWAVTEVPLGASATVLLYTDGLVEGRAQPGSSERLGIAPIADRLAACEPGAIEEGDLRALVDLATEANGTGLPDDVALLALNLR